MATAFGSASLLTGVCVVLMIISFATGHWGWGIIFIICVIIGLVMMSVGGVITGASALVGIFTKKTNGTVISPPPRLNKRLNNGRGEPVLNNNNTRGGARKRG